ncbi:MAG TPA: outer membrane protein assembly factor BamD, partial [Terriglobales bacterium]|nr:outer membrane protein assembly factor BamD [Terriglobales bacterium]
NYPKSPEAVEAQEKLAKCLEYLAEHQFNVAYFYFQQEKYPAARDRFEEIVRKYKDTPTAVKSLFYLGESYRNERNAIRATLAYEALIQHYPESKFAADARTQLAQVEKEKRDPMALLLMRDRRPTAVASGEAKEDPALAKLKDLNLVQKKEVVFEEPGAEKGFFSRVATKLNPFSSDGNKNEDDKKSENAMELLAKRNEEKKKAESEGFMASLWPFGSSSKDGKPAAKSGDVKSTGLVGQIDDSLNQKGIDASTLESAQKPPAADLPKPAAPPPPKTDTTVLLSSIDSNLKKDGKNIEEVPAPPEAAPMLRDPAAAQAAIAQQTAERQPRESKDVQSSGVLAEIDQKLKTKGVEPSKFQAPPTAEELKVAAAQRPQTKAVELAPKVELEKGPLFLNPGETRAEEKPVEQEAKKTDGDTETVEPSIEPPNRILVKGPVQPQSTASAKSAETRKSSSGQQDEPKGAFDQIRQDMESVSKALNPFRW